MPIREIAVRQESVSRNLLLEHIFVCGVIAQTDIRRPLFSHLLRLSIYFHLQKGFT